MKKSKYIIGFAFLFVMACGTSKRMIVTPLANLIPKDTVIKTQMLNPKVQRFNQRKIDSLGGVIFKHNVIPYSTAIDSLKQSLRHNNTISDTKLDTLIRQSEKTQDLIILFMQAMSDYHNQATVGRDSILKNQKSFKVASSVTKELKVKAEAHDTVDNTLLIIGYSLLSIAVMVSIANFFLSLMLERRAFKQKKFNHV